MKPLSLSRAPRSGAPPGSVDESDLGPGAASDRRAPGSALRKFYYGIKPFVPYRLRWTLRRMRAPRLLRAASGTWPICPGSERKPDDWPGWPERKQFAFVLTHDVESQAGLDRVRALAELEMELGFRSCFNFIPEAGYRVPPELRRWLTDHGFEVGVHDLRHDGRLYNSRTRFRKKAARINHYLRLWKATGFRSAFMLRELGWLHDLDIAYDCSTFDTDPFEPQPEGAETIFPYRVGSGDRSYIELPYTLPQDSTLFLLLEEKTTSLWKKKLDWIAKHGGLGLVNIHPDYIEFDRRSKRGFTYPVDLVRDFLGAVREEYRDSFWQPLPGELAEWHRRRVDSAPPAESLSPEPRSPSSSRARSRVRLSGRRIAVLLYSEYPADPRPRRAAEALAEAGAEIDLFCLKKHEQEADSEVIRDVNVFRLPVKRDRSSKWSYVTSYSVFIASCFRHLAIRQFRRHYELVHVHNMPDVLAFGALVPRLFGARILLDLHDPMPELMRSIYGLSETSATVRLLRSLEKWSIRFAHQVLTPNRAFLELFVSRGCPPGKIEIVMNSPQTEIFDPQRARPRATGQLSGNGAGETFRVMHHGFIAERHGIDIALRAIALLRDVIPGIQFHLYGGPTPFLESLENLVDDLGLRDRYHYHGYQPQGAIASAIGESDIGVIPNRRNCFTEINLPTRIFEFLAMDKPVVAPDTAGIRDYFDRKSLFFFQPEDPESLAAAIRWIAENRDASLDVVERGRRVWERHRWETEQENFRGIVSQLLRRRSPSASS